MTVQKKFINKYSLGVFGFGRLSFAPGDTLYIIYYGNNKSRS